MQPSALGQGALRFWHVGLIAGIYFVSARMSLSLAIPPGYATAVWPPSGIALAAILLSGRRIWPGIWIGAALVNITVEASLVTAALIATGNTLEAWVGGALIRRYVGVPRRFERGEDVLKFIVLGALSPAIAATLALVPLALGHEMSGAEMLRNWWTWWQGDVTGIVLVTPLILSWSVGDARPWPMEKRVEAACLAFLLLAAAVAIVAVRSPYFAPFSLTFISLPFIIWAAFRFGQREVTGVTTVVSAVAIWYTLVRADLSEPGSTNEVLLMLLTFISMVVATGLTLVSLINERGRAVGHPRSQPGGREPRSPERLLPRGPALPRDAAPPGAVDGAPRVGPAALHSEKASAPLRVVVLEDDPADADLMVRELRAAGYRVEPRRADTRSSYADALDSGPDVVLADYSVAQFGALDALALLQTRKLDIPLIVVTGSLSDEAAAECIKRGAADYLLKDRLARLPGAVERALEQKRLRVDQALAARALRAGERLKDAIIKSALDCVVTIDNRGSIVEFNPAAESTFGFRRADVLGKPMADWIIPPSMRDAHKRGLQRLLASGESRILGKRLELSAIRADGTEFPVELSVSATGSWDAPLFTAYLRDITERRAAEDKIARLNRVHAMLSGVNGLIVRARDRAQLFEQSCRIAVEQGQFGMAWIGTFDAQTLDVTPVAWAGLGANEIAVDSGKGTARSDVPEGQGLLGRAIREKRPVFSNDIRAEISEGGERRAHAIGRGYRSLIVLPLMVDGAVDGVLGLCAVEPDFFNEEELKLLTELAGDISFALEHIAKAERLNYLAYFDALTGLPNRSLYHERLSHRLHLAAQRNAKLTLFLACVKRFRSINESFGRHAGDALLRELAMRLRNAWPDPDNVARLGADVFAAILGDVGSEADVARVVEKSLSEALGSPFMVGREPLTLSMAAGLAMFPADGSDADTLLRNAEAALKNAKETAEPYSFYQPAMNAAVAQNLLLENKLRRALDLRQFVLHYQPKVELATGLLCGLEALIRWNDPDAGVVPPMRFIPLLEQTGLILDVGRWAIHQALDDHRKWTALGLKPPRIAVNVSPIQLRRKDFVTVVSRAVGEFERAGHGLDLEITESLIMTDIESNIAKLLEIRSLGIGIAIDDFGTGYSSLAYLAKLPVNSLKIDRSFIVTMTESPDSMAIVSTIISLAHSLSLKVIAEGVDTEEQRKALRSLGCDQMQGYLFSKPLPAGETTALLEGSDGAR
jgi:PAS domain S-box-containing protein/diguanylate cyclase (GGDEF)-like protein